MPSGWPADLDNFLQGIGQHNRTAALTFFRIASTGKARLLCETTLILGDLNGQSGRVGTWFSLLAPAL